jgi:Flp pilus assembly protein TadG
MSLELAILTPAVIVMLMLVVGFGRVTHARQLVDQAAAAAARAASLTSAPGPATVAARDMAATTLAQAGIACRTLTTSVDVSAFRPGGQVSATIDCTADLSALASAGMPGSITLTATRTAPLEPLRDLTTGG